VTFSKTRGRKKNGNIENNLLATRKKKRCAFSCRCRFNGKTPTKMNWFLSWNCKKSYTGKGAAGKARVAGKETQICL
jgi:hypothetical protein